MLRIGIEDARLTPGHVSAVPVRIENIGAAPVTVTIRISGVDPAWLPTAPPQQDVGPGATVVVTVPITVPKGYPSAALEVAIEAQASAAPGVDPVPPGRLDARLAIGRAAGIRANLEPGNVPRSGRFRVRLENASTIANVISLAGEAGDGGSLSFRPTSVHLEPGGTQLVRARVRHRRFVTGTVRRLPFTVMVRSPGREAPLEGTHTQGPLVRNRVLTGVALLVLLVAWAAALVVGARALQQRESGTAAAVEANSTADEAADGAGDDDGGSPSGSDAKPGGADGEGSEAGPPSTLAGTVAAPDPVGVQVKIETTSLLDPTEFKPEGTAKGTGTKTMAPITRQTDADGAWAADDLPSPGLYLVTFSKVGYIRQRQVVQTTAEGESVQVDVTLKPGDGQVTGVVRQGSSPRGGVDITISSGSTTLTTRSNDVDGTWSVANLETPGSYRISSSTPGYSDKSQVVELAAGESAAGIAFDIKPGLGSLSGVVEASAESGGGAIPGATVVLTATSGTGPARATPDGDAPATLTRTVTTLSAGEPGHFMLPDLPIPGGYSVTISADGYATATRQLLLSENQTISVRLQKTNSAVVGTVLVGDDVRSEVRVTLTGGSVSLTTTTGPDGYRFDDLAPGTYQLTFDLFGFESTTRPVTVVAGGADVPVPPVTLVITTGPVGSLNLLVDVPYFEPGESDESGGSEDPLEVVIKLYGPDLNQLGGSITITRQGRTEVPVTGLPVGVIAIGVEANNGLYLPPSEYGWQRTGVYPPAIENVKITLARYEG
ncbi:MAG: hypothetical protein JWM47_1944 [Acidimicrobiales bacterium]|nr:hypothetical protein [Acidimicrobiales bacterium]